uniref:Protein hunchback n=1 Tax=Gryllus bimaculatus TaxID=6999 RepID=Q75WT1_GRYBI|nr:hunchback [Gryllus bimaculatus]
MGVAATDARFRQVKPDPNGWDQSPAHPPLYSPPHPHQYSNGPPGTPPHLQGFSNGLAGASPPHAPQHGQPQQQQQHQQQQRLYQGAPQPNGGGPRSPGDEPMDVTDADADGDGDACGGADEEPGLREPRVNAQGKVKTYRCKQCNYVAITKLDFWDHSRSHIKIEKMLTCPRCPFVTEYKHRLEYHLRNHSGSKPFKCDKCPYTCVNKSMLNSHMKSHSSVYQYRCADCTYATKYMHSLKLHLRKYTHKPAMVLNPDGSPNPLPIIDVYGTRRGPKSKPHPLGAKGRPQAGEQQQQLGRGQPAGGAAAAHLPAAAAPAETYHCTFCDMTFGDVVMYTMHMGYHGFADPYTCNMCGQATADRFAFFLHIARSAHY